MNREVVLSGLNRKYTTKGRFPVAAIAAMTVVIMVLAARAMMPERQVDRMVVPLAPKTGQ